MSTFIDRYPTLQLLSVEDISNHKVSFKDGSYWAFMGLTGLITLIGTYFQHKCVRKIKDADSEFESLTFDGVLEKIDDKLDAHRHGDHEIAHQNKTGFGHHHHPSTRSKSLTILSKL